MEKERYSVMDWAFFAFFYSLVMHVRIIFCFSVHFAQVRSNSISRSGGGGSFQTRARLAFSNGDDDDGGDNNSDDDAGCRMKHVVMILIQTNINDATVILTTTYHFADIKPFIGVFLFCLIFKCF